jgi:hypothetical protein
MLILLSYKNSTVLWQNLNWLYTFPYSVIINLKNNMIKLSEQRLSTMMANSSNNMDYFTSKMCVKSIQLL